MKHAVVAVLKNRERVLVVRRGPRSSWAGYWSPLSGKIEADENQKQALVREVSEEVGLRVRAIAKVWECRTDDGEFLLHWWTAEVTGGELTPDNEEVTDARWVRAADFLELEPTFAGDRAFFREVLPALD